MAEAGQVKQVLEKEITCPLCLDIYKEPKKLPCDHIYCKDCLKSLAEVTANATIFCPECRSIALPLSTVERWFWVEHVGSFTVCSDERKQVCAGSGGIQWESVHLWRLQWIICISELSWEIGTGNGTVGELCTNDTGKSTLCHNSTSFSKYHW